MTSPLSQSQLGIYLASQGLDARTGHYQQAFLFKLPEDTSLEKLKGAMEAFVKAHPYLLSRIVTENGQPCVEDHSQEAWKAEITEVENMKSARETFGRPMDLNKDRLFRLEIYKAPDAAYLYADFHHIIADGACVPILLRQINAAYQGEELPQEKMSGADIARAELELRQSPAFEEARTWFAGEFGPGAEVESRILPDISGATEAPCKELMLDLDLNAEAMRDVLDRYRYAESVLFTAVYGLTLAAWNADTRASFSTIWNGRKGVQTRDSFTMCVHTQPVYVEGTPETLVKDVLERMKAQTLGLRARHFYSMADCTQDLDLHPGINFGFQGQFTGSQIPMALGDKTFYGEDFRTNPPGIGLSMEFFTSAEGPYKMRFWYRPDQYSESILRNFAESLTAAVLSLKKADTVGEMEFTSPRQIGQLDSLNPGYSVADTEKTVLDIFRENVRKNPDNIAVVYENTRLSYKEVDRLSDNLAAYIEEKVGPGKVVSIILGRNEWTMVAPLGALKAGCAYQPLDPSYPTERLQFMVQDAQSALLIADEGLEQLVLGFEGPILPTKEIPALPEGKSTAKVRPEDLFILLYTSGTTGTPKGCMINHRNVSLFAQHAALRLDVNAQSRLTAYASFGFDAFVGDLFCSLAGGATIYVIPESIRLDLPALHAYYEQNGITHCFMTTQVATQFALNFPECKGLHTLYTGGEKLSSIPLPKYTLYNCYGPTESICYTISKEVTVREDNIPIGKPFPGIRTYVVNKAGKRLPVGAAGELLEAGLQVGDGYLNRPEKTAEAFADNPYDPDPAFRRLYRTGDVVRYRENGDIEFIGRKDSQVKIRGFRIELKEVEGVIREYPGIKDVTVQAFEEEGAGGGKFLAAYIVAEETVDISALNAFILDRKPPYMVPAVTMQIDAIPLNVNQKVDRKALPKPEHKKAENKVGDAPFNILEEELAALIKETTNIEGESLTDSLMLYGLSSLSGLRLATELYKRYGVQADMNAFAKTATLQSIENEVLKKLMEGGGPAAAETPADTIEATELTFQQAGVYFDCMKAPEETIYNIPMRWKFPENVQAEALKNAVLQVLEVHPSLKSRFEQREGKVYQVSATEDIPVTIEILSDTTKLQNRQKSFIKPFNLETGPLGRIVILDTPDGVSMLSDFHHLVFDGRSYDLFIQQVCQVLEGQKPEPETFSYFQYAAWQKEAENSPAFSQAKDFFTGQLQGMESATSVLPDLEPKGGTGREVFLIKKVGADIHLLCQKLGISAASYYLAAAYLTLSAYSGNKKVHICTISNGRNDLRTSDTFGMFVNTLALAGDCSVSEIEAFLKQTDKNFQDTLLNQQYPFARVATDFGFQPQVMLAYQVGVLTEYKVNGRKVEGENLDAGAPKFPLSIYIDGREGEEAIVLGYDNSRYSEPLMQAFADSMECVVRNLLKCSNLQEVPFVDGEQLARLDSFNAYTQKVDVKETIVSLFRRQARKTPDAPAVSFEATTLTYSQLDALTDRIAAKVAAMGLQAEDVVSVLIHRSQWMAIASLGILKSGCAYQPLDPSYPTERLNFMIADAAAKLLIADEDLLPLISDYKGPVLKTTELEALPEGPVPQGPKPENLFILLYTSGSTGVPKGCMLEHRNLVNFCAWYQQYYQLKPGSKVAAYASYGFDACMMDMYPALTGGACVCIIPEETRHDMFQLDRFITENGITHSFMTTQVGVMFAKNFPDNPSLKHLSVGGEKLVSLDPPSYSFHNGYGPTECTIFCTIFPVGKKEANIPIGHPLDNTLSYVVDKEFRRLPVGAAGELIIAGAGVGRGYLNRPDKTAESFLDNPFSPGMRAYRSGDIVRFRADGNIEFVGRNDGQVKIRGFRVELKEVEAVLREIPGVKDVTVQAFDSPSGGKFIAAYVVAEGTFDAKAAGDFIRERKPPYMVPASFVQLEKIPLNVNQKVDRKALPTPTPTAREEYVAPANDMEKAICDIFAEVLNLEKVSVLDNFFDLGGSSLVVTNVMVNAEKRGIHFAYADVFSHPTARSLAGFLSGTETPEQEDKEITGYDYTAIHQLLAGNTLEALANGKRQPLEGQILLTGATGFLGIHVLRELIENTSEETVIWCLMRGKDPTVRLREMLTYYFENVYTPHIGHKVRVVKGDITDTKCFQSLKDSGTPFNIVINCAANVKHFSKGTDIEDINYGGVKNLVAFCQATGARLVQVSTESVAGSNPGVESKMMTESMLFFGQLTNNQYIHSKFLAERYILEKMAEGTLNAKIMRAGNLSPRASDGEFQINLNSNAAMGRIKAIKMIGACPYAQLEARMEFSPIDQSAIAVILLAQTPKENCVFHVSNDHLLPMDDILSRLQKIDDISIEYVETEEFMARMEKMKEDPEKAQYLSSLLAYSPSPNQAVTAPNIPSVSFTMQVLHRLGFSWDHTSSNYVDMFLDVLKAMMFFEL